MIGGSDERYASRRRSNAMHETATQVGDTEHLKVFANAEAAETWLEENDPEGVAFEIRGFGVNRIRRRTILAMLLIVALAVLWNVLSR